MVAYAVHCRHAQRGEAHDVVGLIGAAVAPDVSASEASVHDHVPLGRVLIERDWRHQAAARIRAVGGPDVYV